jgi:hypothetical protein
MLEEKQEEFHIGACPRCNEKHLLKIIVSRELKQIDSTKIRVPEFRKISVELICPTTEKVFKNELYIQEDKFAVIKKISRG